MDYKKDKMLSIPQPSGDFDSRYRTIINQQQVIHHNHSHYHSSSSSSNWRAPQQPPSDHRNDSNAQNVPPPPAYQPNNAEEDVFEPAPLNRSPKKKVNNKRLIGQVVRFEDVLKPNKPPELFSSKYIGMSNEAIEKDREEYWLKEDLDNEWCLFCYHSIYSSKETQAQMPFVDTIHTLVDDYIGKMPDKKLIEIVHSLFVSTVRPNLPKREVDPYTNKPCPPHWWYPSVIEEHLLKHEINVKWERMRTYRNICEIGRDLEDTMRKRRKNTEETIYDLRLLDGYNKHIKLKSEMEQRLTTSNDTAHRQN